MKQTERIKIQADGDQNVKFLFASAMLGMLDMIETKTISTTDAAMAFALPIMHRTGEDTVMHQICSMVEELDTYPPTRRSEEIEKIRKLCYEMMSDYSRADNERISFEIQHGGSML